jgi:hypothetical protein
MEHQPNQPDDAIDKTLAALRNAAPPEGMEARIAHRLQQPVAPSSYWRDLFAATTPSAFWLRGAFTGAAVALLAVCAVLSVIHGLRSYRPQRAQNIAARQTAPSVVPVRASSVETASSPCTNPSALRARTATPAPKAVLLRTAGDSQRHPILAGPLTAQERALIQLARTADPQQLASLNSESQAKLKAQDADEFERFFAPPAHPKTPDENE